MKRYLKEHKIVVAATILMLIIIVIAFFAKQAFFSNSGNAVYGDRLDGIEAVEVDSKQKKEIISNLENDSSVKKATYKLQGKIINVIALVNDDIEVNKSKEIGNKVIEKLSDKQKKYFDVQIFIKKSSKDEKFPIIGYKHHNKDNITWTKDR